MIEPLTSELRKRIRITQTLSKVREFFITKTQHPIRTIRITHARQNGINVKIKHNHPKNNKRRTDLFSKQSTRVNFPYTHIMFGDSNRQTLYPIVYPVHTPPLIFQLARFAIPIIRTTSTAKICVPSPSPPSGLSTFRFSHKYLLAGL